MLARFPTDCDWSPFWPIILPSLQTLATRLSTESASAASTPALLLVLSAIAASPYLAPVLGNRTSLLYLTPGLIDPDDEDAMEVEQVPLEESLAALPISTHDWAVSGAGSALIASVAAAVASAATSVPARDACLEFFESLIRLGPVMLHIVLLPHIDTLLTSMHVLMSSASAEAAKGGRRARGSVREMAILEQLGPYISRAETAKKLSQV